METGKLRSRIIIQQKSSAFDAAGEPGGAWTTFATVWASIKPSGGGERYVNQQVIANVSHEIGIRFNSGITPKMRVLYGSRVFDILAVHDIDERHIEMRLICQELTGGGIT